MAEPITSPGLPPGIGRVIVQWQCDDGTQQPRSHRWYVIAGVVAVLLIAYGVWMGDFLFSGLLVLFGLTYGLMRRQPSKTMSFAITDNGVAAGRTFYSYQELKRFWIIYQPPEVKNLYLEFRNPFKPYLPLPLGSQNPVTARHALLDYLSEDLRREDEPVLDQISRLLKL
ncbi:MAG: hypothetical protein Q7S23_02015 [bacterium]|nr:hypothetical protein [bacterium]